MPAGPDVIAVEQVDDERHRRYRTPVGAPDPGEVAAFWARCVEATGIVPSSPVPPAT